MQATGPHEDEQRYSSATDCLEAVRARVAWGWQVAEVRPSGVGYTVLFRLLDGEEPSSEADSSPHEGEAP